MTANRELHSQGGSLPELELDPSMPFPLLISRASAQLGERGLLTAVMLSLHPDWEDVELPILCKVGNQRWVPYIETDPWDEDTVYKILFWLAVLRRSQYSDARVQVYARGPLPPNIAAVVEDTPLARFQLEGLLEGRPGDFSGNARTLLGLLERFFDYRLQLEPLALGVLDEFIDHHFFSPSPVRAIATTKYMFGSLTGEILRIALGGSWVRQPAVPMGWELCMSGITANPLGRAERRFINGQEDSLAAFYQAIFGMVKKQ